MTQEAFTGKIIKEMIESGVSIVVNTRKRISKHNLSNTFDSWGKIPILTIQNTDNHWRSNFNNLVHEYCHFKQWQEKSQIYADGLINLFLLDLYCQGKNQTFTEEQLWSIQELELDCEQRVLEINKRFKLNIDLSTYIPESNAYIYSYRFIKENRKNTFKITFSDDHIRGLFPKTLITKTDCQKDMQEYRKIFNNTI